jgi:hypothetical protein
MAAVKKNAARVPRCEATTPPTTGPTATLSSCAPCTRAMATETRSRGADVVASTMAIGEKPPNSPRIRRATNSCATDRTRPMAAMITVKPVSDRMSIALRPRRSASRPISGEISPETAGDTAVISPDQSAMRAGSLTPSSRT